MWGGAPLMGIVAALDPHLPGWLHVPLRVYVGPLGRVHPAARGGDVDLRLRAARVLARRARAAAAGIRSAAQAHARLAAGRARVGRHLSTAIILAISALDNPFAFLASLFSFGVLLAFTAAQLAVIQLRRTEPNRRRPFKVPLNVRIRGVEVPIPSVVGAAATFAVWIVAMATHPAARYAGPPGSRPASSSTCSSAESAAPDCWSTSRPRTSRSFPRRRSRASSCR